LRGGKKPASSIEKTKKEGKEDLLIGSLNGGKGGKKKEGPLLRGTGGKEMKKFLSKVEGGGKKRGKEDSSPAS